MSDNNEKFDFQKEALSWAKDNKTQVIVQHGVHYSAILMLFNHDESEYFLKQLNSDLVLLGQVLRERKAARQELIDRGFLHKSGCGLPRLCVDVQAKESQTKNFSGNKYHRRIIGLDGDSIQVDVYSVLRAFEVSAPGIQHALKKLLCAGIRGKATQTQDLSEAIDAIKAEIKHLEVLKND